MNRIRKNIQVRQRDPEDSLAACIASLCLLFRIEKTIDDVRDSLLRISNRDVFRQSIVVLTDVGFGDCKQETTPITSATMPLLAFVTRRDRPDHFVVVLRADPGLVSIMDPSDGEFHHLKMIDFEKMWTGKSVTFAPPKRKSTEAVKSALSNIFHLVGGQRRVIAEIAIGAVIHLAISILPALLIQQIIDQVIPQQNTGLLKFFSVVVVALLFAQILIGIIKNITTLKTGHSIHEKLLQRYQEKLLKLPQSVFDQLNSIDLLQRINDSIAIRSAINELFTTAIRGVLTIVFSLAIMFILSPGFTIITIAMLAVYGCLSWLASVFVINGGQPLEQSAFELERRVFENISNMRSIRQFSLQEKVMTSTNETMKPVLGNINEHGAMHIYGSAIGDFASRVFTVAVLWVGTLFVLDGSFTLGTMLCFLMLIELCKNPLSEMTMLPQIIKRAGLAFDNIQSVLDIPGDPHTPALAEPVKPLGDIHFKDVAFHYPGKSEVLIDLNLSVKQSSIVAILGPPGSGKSTIAELMQFSYRPQRGNIFIGKYNSTDLDPQSLRKSIYVATESTDIFHATLAQNIAPCDEHPDLSRIMNLCVQLGVVPFIERLPNGFNTRLGHGYELNEQQKKIVGLLRAFYFQAEILVLDEPTHSLELSTSLLVRKMILDQKLNGTTIIILTSKLEIAAIADEIIGVDKGVVTTRSSPAIPA